jgi:hypothetical protein
VASDDIFTIWSRLYISELNHAEKYYKKGNQTKKSSAAGSCKIR